MIMFVQLQFDQEARRAMILQNGNFKGICFVGSFLGSYYLNICLNAVISNYDLQESFMACFHCAL